MKRRDWPDHFGPIPKVLPDVPPAYSELALSAPDWEGPIWIEPYHRKVRIRYELPFGLGERSEVHADRRVAAVREAKIVESIRTGCYIDPAYRLVSAVDFAVMLIETAPSIRSHRELNEPGRIARYDWFARHLRPLVDDMTVAQMISSANTLDQALASSPLAATSRYVSRHNLRWVLRQLVDLGLAQGRTVLGLEKLPLERGQSEVPEDVDLDRVLDALSVEERIAVDVILETLCRPGEYDALLVRDWRPDLGVLAIRSTGRSRSKTKTGMGATYQLSGSIRERIESVIEGRTSGPLFVDARGSHLTEDVLAGRLAEACRASGSLQLTLRDLRMIGASRRLAGGEPPQDVQRRLRHTGIVTGERFYLRCVPGRDRLFVDALDAALAETGNE